MKTVPIPAALYRAAVTDDDDLARAYLADQLEEAGALGLAAECRQPEVIGRDGSAVVFALYGPDDVRVELTAGSP